MTALTSGEVRASLRAGSNASDGQALPDPHGWIDLCAQEDLTVDVVIDRLAEQRTPMQGHVIRWPKESEEYRPMAWIDPLDQVIYRALAGRLLPMINASIKEDNVLSARLKSPPPQWEFQDWGGLIAERRDRGQAFLRVHPVLGIIDVRHFYPTISPESLEKTLGALPVPHRTFEFVLAWLDQLDKNWGVRGLPIGHDASRVLANGVLAPCDRLLEVEGKPFIRYVDDTWLFLDQSRDFHGLLESYGDELERLGLEVHPQKSKAVVGDEALDEIRSRAMASLGDVLDSPNPEGRSAALALFEHALEDPRNLKSDLRRAIRLLTGPRHPRPLEALRTDSDLIRCAPSHWVSYLSAMLGQKKSRQLVDDDWVIDQAEQGIRSRDEVHKTIIFLRAASGIQLGRELGLRVRDLATSDGSWRAPARTWAAHVWGSSDAYKPSQAVEQAEARGDYCTRRAFAMTLRTKSSHRKFERWCRRVALVDPELAPTAAWLQAGPTSN